MTSGWTISLQKPVGKPFSPRVCVLFAVVCGALAAPGIAQAAGTTPGAADVSATINSAVAQINAVSPAAAAATQPAVDRAFAAVSSASDLAAAQTAAAEAATHSPPVAPPSTPAAAVAPAGVVSEAVAPVLAAAGLSSATPPPASAPKAHRVSRRATSPGSSAPARVRSGSSRLPGTLAGGPGTFPESRFVSAAESTSRASAGVSSFARSSRARSSGSAPAGAHRPRPVPPVPQGPAPDFASSLQSGGQGLFAPLLVAALAAALALASFPFSSRLLPQLAFRKPRRVRLAVWHPG